MKDFKGTKGEWKVILIQPDSIRPTMCCVESNDHFVVDSILNVYDAQLIAAAPNLLEALQEALDLLKQTEQQIKNKGTYGLGGVFITCAIEKSQKAINKALGE